MFKQVRRGFCTMTDDQRKHLIDRLSAEGFKNIDLGERTIGCDSIVEGHIIKLRCTLSPIFPYELPTVYIEENCYKNISPVPHVNSDFSICTFDKSTVIPNFKFPVQVIVASLLQAKSIIHQGILKENLEDFYEEFNAYWHLECDGKAESIISIPSKPCTIKCYFSGNEVYLADNKTSLDQYLSNISIKERYLKDYHDCIYLPLNINIRPPFPKTNYDLYCLLKTDTANFRAYNKYLKAHIPQGAFVAFLIPYKGHRDMQLWMHTGISTNVNGFRKGHVPVGIAYLNDTKKSSPLMFDVEDMSQERLFTRGGTGLTKTISRVAVIGCGSVGSYIVEALSEYGVASFVLVDNEKLSTENIARHYCGYEYVNTSKVSAISNKLVKHNPNIKCDVYEENGHVFINDHLNVLNTCDIIFVATASAPLEYRIVEMINDLQICRPVVLTWVEPFLAAGQALILNKPQNVFEELFDKNYIFTKRVITNSDNFLLKEAGCQSTFIPYAAFSLKRYIYAFLDYLIYGSISKGKSGNYVFTWCGDIISARKKGCQIAPEWAEADNYSIHVKRID